MNVRLRTLVIAGLISVSAVVWGNSKVELFDAIVDDGRERVRVTLRESPGQRSENEGYIVPAIHGTPTYTLVEPLPATDEIRQLSVSFAGDGGTAFVELIGAEDQVVAARAVAAAGHTSVARSVALLVPAGRSIEGFRVAGEAPGQDAQSPFRILGAEIGPPMPGAVEIEDGISGEVVLRTGPETRVVDWGASTDGAASGRVWSLSFDGTSFWLPLTAVEVSYHYVRPSADEYAPWEDGRFPVASLQVGARSFQVRLRPGRHSVFVHPSSTPESLVVISAEEGFRVRSARPVDVLGDDPTSPVPADLSTLFDYPRALWRQDTYEVFQWSLYPEVVIVDSVDYAVQSRFFKRLAFFVEKIGFRGQILSDDQLAGRHGYNAHNYSGEGLAAFYNAAASAGVSLHREEILLRDLAIRQRIIVAVEGGFKAGSGGVLGVSRESDEVTGLRRLLLSHEAYHGVYYAEPQYVEAVATLWDGLSDDERQFWQLYLSGLQYDVSDPYLLRNEYHAYLLQQPIAEVSWLYNVRAQQRLRRWFPNSSAWIDRFYSERPDTMVNQAIALNEALFAATGLVGGDVFCLVTTPR